MVIGENGRLPQQQQYHRSTEACSGNMKWHPVSASDIWGDVRVDIKYMSELHQYTNIQSLNGSLVGPRSSFVPVNSLLAGFQFRHTSQLSGQYNNNNKEKNNEGKPFHIVILCRMSAVPLVEPKPLDPFSGRTLRHNDEA